MKLVLERTPFDLACTIGSLFVDDSYECVTLEDVVREVPGLPVVQWKVPGETAIPVGTYDIKMLWSGRFGKLMPHLIDVPGFDQIEIHPGNTDVDTHGCILVGTTVGVESILQSRKAFDPLYDKFMEAHFKGEPMSIEIKAAP